MVKLSIVIPVYNEEVTLSSLLDQVETARLPDGVSREIILVDDCSTDNTRDVVTMYRANPLYKIFFHDKNMGKGAALRTGFAQATGDIVLVQDADLEYSPAEYGQLLEPILRNKADVVYGSRFLGGQPHRVLYFWHRVANGLITLMSNMFSDLNFTDVETCYKVFRRQVLAAFVIEEDRFGFDPEITAKIGHLSRTEGLRIYEIGISYFGRTYEEGKKIGLKDAFRAFWCILLYNTTGFARFLKYIAVGLIIGGVQWLLAWVGSGLFGPVGAFVVSGGVAAVAGYYLHPSFSFRSIRKQRISCFSFIRCSVPGLLVGVVVFGWLFLGHGEPLGVAILLGIFADFSIDGYFLRSVK